MGSMLVILVVSQAQKEHTLVDGMFAIVHGVLAKVAIPKYMSGQIPISCSICDTRCDITIGRSGIEAQSTYPCYLERRSKRVREIFEPATGV